MKKENDKLRIGQIAKKLKVKEFVIRFWEKEFHLSAKRSEGGQRFYSKEDENKLQTIKELLYEKGFTIAGAKNYMKATYNNNESELMAASKTNFQKEDTEQIDNTAINPQLSAKIFDLQKKLIKLRELL